jgi:hypothetical protein
MGILEDAREVGALPQGPRPGALTRVHAIAQLVSINSTTQRATVVLDGGQPVELPYLPGSYTGFTTVLVLCDPAQGGRGAWVLGPVGALADAPPAPPPPSGTVTASALVLPQWSGTWRVSRAAWDRWNTDRYGGRSDLYQGDGYGSGTLIGLATYGDQIANLGATAITAAVLTVQRNGSGGAAAVTVQGSPNGTPPAGAPSASGDSASSAVLGATDRGQITLTAGMREALRTGAAKGLALVGATYAGVFGTSRPDGMALALTYTRPA